MSKPRLLFAVIVALFLGGAVASLTWAGQRSADRIAEGVRIAGVDVGGLEREAALARVWSRLRPRATRSVRVTVAGRTYVLNATRADVRLRLPAAVDQAVAASQRGSLIERGWREITGAEVSRDVSVRPVASRSAVRAYIERVKRRVERPAVKAELSMDVDRVIVSPHRRGRRLTAAEGLEDRIMRALTDLRAPRSLRARTESVEPDVTRAEVWDQTPVVVTVSRSDRRARLFRKGELVASYRVAVGEPKYPTPTGRFAVQTKQKDPVWNVPNSEWAGDLAGKTIPAGDPRNALVARWIGFDGAVGFHGTKSLESLGRAASRGCVRMSREDVISLFARVDVGTPVLVGR
jgi:hypothetical protein